LSHAVRHHGLQKLVMTGNRFTGFDLAPDDGL